MKGIAVTVVVAILLVVAGVLGQDPAVLCPDDPRSTSFQWVSCLNTSSLSLPLSCATSPVSQLLDALLRLPSATAGACACPDSTCSNNCGPKYCATNGLSEMTRLPIYDSSVCPAGSMCCPTHQLGWCDNYDSQVTPVDPNVSPSTYGHNIVVCNKGPTPQTSRYCFPANCSVSGAQAACSTSGERPCDGPCPDSMVCCDYASVYVCDSKLAGVFTLLPLPEITLPPTTTTTTTTTTEASVHVNGTIGIMIG